MHRSVHEDFVVRLAEAAAKQRAGDPADPETTVGPAISPEARNRVAAWMDEATAAGATAVEAGTFGDGHLRPAVLDDVPPDARVWSKEVFGPVISVAAFDAIEEAIDLANDTEYGLQAGIFTRDLFKMLNAWDRLEVGGVVIGDVPSYRVDNMPYGGVKDSGLGREGVRFAMEDMTEIRNLVIRRR